MVERNYPALRETVWHTVLPNGLNVYVDTRPEYGKQFAFFAARYGGMDLRFRGEDGEWVDTPRGWPTSWSTRCLTPRTETPSSGWPPRVWTPTPTPPPP